MWHEHSETQPKNKDRHCYNQIGHSLGIRTHNIVREEPYFKLYNHIHNATYVYLMSKKIQWTELFNKHKYATCKCWTFFYSERYLYCKNDVPFSSYLRILFNVLSK